jgi:hypothetical protein
VDFKPVSAAPSDHLVGIGAMQRSLRQRPGSAGSRAEDGGLVAIANANCIQILVKELFELVVRRHSWR